MGGRVRGLRKAFAVRFEGAAAPAWVVEVFLWWMVYSATTRGLDQFLRPASTDSTVALAVNLAAPPVAWGVLFMGGGISLAVARLVGYTWALVAVLVLLAGLYTGRGLGLLFGAFVAGGGFQYANACLGAAIVCGLLSYVVMRAAMLRESAC